MTTAVRAAAAPGAFVADDVLAPRRQARGGPRLTPRESEVLGLAAEGLTVRGHLGPALRLGGDDALAPVRHLPQARGHLAQPGSPGRRATRDAADLTWPAPTRAGAWTDWAIWLVLRLALVGIIVGLIPWPEQVNDLTIYADWVQGSLQHGRFPTDEMWQYPPLAGPVFLLGAWLPGERLGFVTLFLGFDAAIMAMLTHQARRTGLAGGTRLWALLPLIVGPLLLARFDVVPTAFAVAAVLLAARPLASGALAATGTWLKVWPVLVLAALRRRDLPRGVAGALAATAVIAGVLVVTTVDPMSFLGGQRDRGLQIESLAAWPFLVARLAGAPVEVVYRYGAHEIDAAGVDVVARSVVVLTLILLGRGRRATPARSPRRGVRGRCRAGHGAVHRGHQSRLLRAVLHLAAGPGRRDPRGPGQPDAADHGAADRGRAGHAAGLPVALLRAPGRQPGGRGGPDRARGAHRWRPRGARWASCCAPGGRRLRRWGRGPRRRPGRRRRASRATARRSGPSPTTTRPSDAPPHPCARPAPGRSATG